MSPPPRSLSRSGGIFALCLSLAFVAMAWVAVSVYAQDLPGAGDDDLSLVNARLAKNRNALTPLTAATQALVYPVDYEVATDRIDLTIIGAEWDDAWTTKLIDDNAAALTRFDLAQHTDGFQVRVGSVYGEARARSDWLMLVKLQALSARAMAMRGQQQEAIDAALLLANFGSKVRRLDGGRMIHYLSGTSMMRIALSALQRILKDADISPGQAVALLESLEGLRLARADWAEVARGDYQWSKGVLDESVAARDGEAAKVSRDPFARGVLESMLSITPIEYSLQRNRTLDRLAGHYRKSIEEVPSVCLRMPRNGASPKRPKAPAATSVERNALGDYWADLSRVSMDVYRQTSCVSETLLSAVEVMVALRAYELNRGSMPDDLKRLVPEYFAALPLDYFDGEPIRYLANKHLLYSVGTDFADAMGERRAGEPCNAELTYPIPFATGLQSVANPLRLTCGGPKS
ncbi:MAG: hypothetical protein ACI8W3_000996 [Myxococcota bacterium]